MSAGPSLYVTPWLSVHRIVSATGPRRVSWAALVRALSVPRPLPPEGKRALPGWSPGWFSVAQLAFGPPPESRPLPPRARPTGAARLEAAALAMSALVLDFDKQVPPLPVILAPWRGALAHAHTSSSHTPEAPRWRLVLPLARPVRPAFYRAALRWAWNRSAAVGAEPDRSTADACRLWFVPAVATGGTFEAHEQPGTPLDPLDLAAEVHRWAPERPARRAAARPARGPAERWATSACASELEAVRTAREGSRADTLVASAYRLGQLIGADLLEREATLSALVEAAELAGLSPAEARRHAARGLAAGTHAPRTPAPLAGR